MGKYFKSKINLGRVKERSLWSCIKNSTMLHVFPDFYHASIWADWEKRIKEGHESEGKIISKLMEKNPNEDLLNEMYLDDVLHICDITNNMYAALIVSMWVELELFFGDLTRLSSIVLKINERTTDPHNAKEFFDHFKKIGIKLDEIKEFNTVNAIRILNNAFKHNNGRYKLKKNPFSNINEELCEKWHIDERNIQIDYSKISIEELVLACNTFCCELIKKVENTSDKKRAQQN